MTRVTIPPEAMIDALFEPVPNSRCNGRVQCRICGDKGYHTGGKGWQRRHLNGHDKCPDCGKLLPNIDGRHRRGCRP
jgi:hypothetical protein